MYEEKDYIMRLIHELIRTLIKLLCGADPDRSEEELLPAAKKGRYLSLRQMLDDGEINQAENLLQEELDIHDRADLEMALLFYRSLNRKSDEFLEDHNFSREEIRDGISYVVDLYGLRKYAGCVPGRFLNFCNFPSHLW